MSRTPVAKIHPLVALALVAAALGLVACGGSDDDSTGGGEGGASVVEIETVEGSELAYTTESAEAEAGRVTIEFTNPQSRFHNVDIAHATGGDVLKGKRVKEGTNSETITLQPGAYTFYCSVPGHKEAGMEGTLTVK